jgi:arsenate reductase
MLFICYPKCSTCQKARAWLDENGFACDFRDIKLENPTTEELTRWWKLSGLPLKKFFNTSGLQYKALGLKDKLPAMSEDEQIALLATDGMLVKRPLLVGEDFVLTGFRPKEWEERAVIVRYDFAPLDGITKVVFRRVHHAMFGGPDRIHPLFLPTGPAHFDPAGPAGTGPGQQRRPAPGFPR